MHTMQAVSCVAAALINSAFERGRWDRDRTCNLRFWSLLPFVQGRSRKYTMGLKMAYFDGPKYVEVHQRSSALGSKLGSMQPVIPISTRCHLECWGQELKEELGRLI